MESPLEGWLLAQIIIQILLAILLVTILGGILAAVKRGFNEVLTGLEAIERRLAAGGGRPPAAGPAAEAPQRP